MHLAADAAVYNKRKAAAAAAAASADVGMADQKQPGAEDTEQKVEPVKLEAGAAGGTAAAAAAGGTAAEVVAGAVSCCERLRRAGACMRAWAAVQLCACLRIAEDV